MIPLILGVFLASTIVGEKKRAWQSGRITFVETRFRSLDPIVPGGKVNYSPYATVRYTIAGADKTYVFEMPRPKKATITGNRTVRFAIEKDKAFVIDDNGDEKKLDVVAARSATP